MFHILYFLPYTSRDRYTRLRNTIINQFYFLIIHSKWTIFTLENLFLFSIHLLPQKTPIQPMRRFFRNYSLPKKKKKKNRCGSRLERKVGWNNVRFRLKRWLNKRFPRDYLPAGTAPVNACNTRVDDAAAAATNLVRVPCWVKGMWRVCVLETWIEVQRVGELLGKCMTAGRRRRGGG